MHRTCVRQELPAYAAGGQSGLLRDKAGAGARDTATPGDARRRGLPPGRRCAPTGRCPLPARNARVAGRRIKDFFQQ